MKEKLREFGLLVLAVCVILLAPVFFARNTPIEVEFPEFTVAQAEEDSAKNAEEAAAAEARARAEARERAQRRIYACKSDEECIIVDKDLCGCLVGPSGVTAINSAEIIAYNRTLPNATKTCPDTPASLERECSPRARAVCERNLCKIKY